MTLAKLLNKPEYWFRPSQIFRKLRIRAGDPAENEAQPVRLPWGDVLSVRHGDAIGRSLLNLGVHELAVSELLWRLTDAGDTCLDIGANLGYMTSLLGAQAGPRGRVFSFEPHPQVFSSLKRNVDNLSSKVWVTVHNEAIGATDGVAKLVEPANFNENQGLASFALESAVPGVSHRVTLRRLDSVFAGDKNFGVMKVDVEGAELDVFRGAERLLRNRRIRDIVWEDHHAFPSDSVQLLARHGYRVYEFAKRLSGPSVWDPFVRSRLGLPWETVNYLATLDPSRVELRLRDRGWRCLRGRSNP